MEGVTNKKMKRNIKKEERKKIRHRRKVRINQYKQKK